MNDKLRGTGRTTREIMRMPDEGGIFIVHNGPMRSYVHDLMEHHRGEDFAQRCLIAVVRNLEDVDRVRGIRLPIYIDHAWFDAPGTTYDMYDRLLEVKRDHACFE